MSDEPLLVPLPEVGHGEIVPLDVAGRRMLLARVDDVYRVFARECPHEWVDLAEGVLDGEIVQCMEHGYEFDLLTGKCVTPLTWCSDLLVLDAEARGDHLAVFTRGSPRA